MSWAARACTCAPRSPTSSFRRPRRLELKRVETAYERLGPTGAHALLAERDPQAAARVHANDRRRVVRALELLELGTSLAPTEDRLWSDETRHPTAIFGLDVPRDELGRRIEARTDSMVERGVEAEVRSAVSGPISPTARAIHGLTDFAELPLDEAVAVYNRRVPLRGVPAQVDAADSRPRADRGGPAAGGGGRRDRRARSR